MLRARAAIRGDVAGGRPSEPQGVGGRNRRRAVSHRQRRVQRGAHKLESAKSESGSAGPSPRLSPWSRRNLRQGSHVGAGRRAPPLDGRSGRARVYNINYNLITPCVIVHTRYKSTAIPGFDEISGARVGNKYTRFGCGRQSVVNRIYSMQLKPPHPIPTYQSYIFVMSGNPERDKADTTIKFPYSIEHPRYNDIEPIKDLAGETEWSNQGHADGSRRTARTRRPEMAPVRRDYGRTRR